MRHGGDIYHQTVDYDFSVNTNPYGIPERVKVALCKAAQEASQYPSYDQEELKEAIAKRYQLKENQLALGNGASELFVAIARAFMPKKAGLVAPGFYGYTHCLNSVGAEIIEYVLSEENGFEVTEQYINTLTEDMDMIFIACPNNPTGRSIQPEIFIKIMEKAKEVHITVVLDVCFFELMDEESQKAWAKMGLSYSFLVETYDNLILVNAFTKTMSIAGVRLGFAMADSAIIEKLKAQLPEWNVSIFAQKAGIAAALESSYALDSVRKLSGQKAVLAKHLRELGFKVYPSHANFLLLWDEHNEYEDLMNKLLAKKILIRDCSNFTGLVNGYYRVAVKDNETNKILIQALSEIRDMIDACEEETVLIKKNLMECVEHVLPMDIEKNSMATIEYELGLMGISLDPEKAPVIKRCIHTAADFEYAQTLRFSEDAINIARQLIRDGAHIVTDTNMAFSGVNKKELAKYGGQVHCYMADEDVARIAKERGVTRATVSMEKAAKLDKPVIFAIGNAPTALVELRKMYDQGSFKPAFIIGVPVGFVNVVVSKELIMETDIPYIVNAGRKGGSNVAAAICNALLYGMRE